MHHAILYTGPDAGTLAAAAMRHAAEALAPTVKTPENHPDCHILDNGGKEIKIDQIREWRQAAYYRPNEAACHVFLMVDADSMNAGAQNALLALLEEPPTPCLFLLLCRNEDALLPTVRSRLHKQSLTGAAQAFPAEAMAWAKQTTGVFRAGSEFQLFKALLSVEKLPRADLCVYLECLIAVMYENMGQLVKTAAPGRPYLTNAAFFTTMEKLRQARALLDSNVGNGHALAGLCAELSVM